MGQRVEFPSNGHTCQGYFAAPSGSGPAVVVIQEWWGLVPHIEDVVERFAKAGFATVAPDLYHGKTTKSPDEAQKSLMELDADRAVQEIIGAGRWIVERPECSSKTYGVVGFCMGGGLAKLAATRDRNVSAAVSFYGGFIRKQLEWENLNGPILLIAGENDKGVPPAGERALAEKLEGMGKQATAQIYANADHAFFNDTRPEVYNREAATDAWERTLDLFRTNVK
jgi:carboxymethylenebutenolidase